MLAGHPVRALYRHQLEASAARRRPDAILADGGYDSAAFREWLRSKRIEPIIPQRGRKEIIGLGTVRWVVEQSIVPPPPVQTPRSPLGPPPAHA
ncbi:transposase [Saccharothrix sp. ALI-22-I]|uniref:transposase n=1 Tax=Saccharothrix sp. ALI-22-I TaxID=1933778 RepID=UPI00117B0D4B